MPTDSHRNIMKCVSPWKKRSCSQRDTSLKDLWGCLKKWFNISIWIKIVAIFIPDWIISNMEKNKFVCLFSKVMKAIPSLSDSQPSRQQKGVSGGSMKPERLGGRGEGCGTDKVFSKYCSDAYHSVNQTKIPPSIFMWSFLQNCKFIQRIWMMSK